MPSQHWGQDLVFPPPIKPHLWFPCQLRGPSMRLRSHGSPLQTLGALGGGQAAQSPCLTQKALHLCQAVSTWACRGEFAGMINTVSKKYPPTPSTTGLSGNKNTGTLTLVLK
uniref:Uncharacterized protein n=1 Tax=Sphaerodactylus townsendi TaxID=933632 RepID=A0ACB8EVX7_9SAUR